MGRQRNNLQSKGKDKSPERMLNEIEKSKLSDPDFKIMVIMILKELSESTRNSWEATKKLQRNTPARKKRLPIRDRKK